MLEWISNFAGSLVVILTNILFVFVINKDRVKINYIILAFLVLIATFALQYSYCLNSLTIKSLLLLSMFSINTKIIFNISLNKTIILTFFFYLFLMFGDLLSVKLCSCLFGKEFFYQTIAGGLVGSIIPALIVLFLGFLFRKVLNKFSNIQIKHRIILIYLFSLLCITAIYYATYQYGTEPFDNLIGFLYIIVVVIILLNSFIQEYKNSQLTLEYDNLLEFIKKYEVEIDSQRILRHESKNQLLIIKSKIIDNDTNEAIIDYIDEVLNDYRRVNQIEYAKFAYLPSNGIKGLFYFKVATAQEKNIRVELNISNKIEESFLDKLSSNTFNQLGKILGVFLDNAIEGAETSQKKAMVIEIIMKGNDVLFVISNSFNSRLKENDKSTKGVGRGYGLLLVNSILISNKKFETDTEIIDDFYVKKLLVKE